MNRKTSLFAVLASCLIVGTVQAKPIAYPAKGQSSQQQQKDDGECYVWAKSTTGIDPAAVAAAPPPPQGSTVGSGDRARGAVRGAAFGAIVGDSSEAAGKGAIVGTLSGGAQARHKQRSQQAAAQSKQQEAINTFYRAYSACMEGRGYTIK